MQAGRPAQSMSYMWVFAGGAPEKFCFIYRYDPSRRHQVPLAFFEDFKGYLHCDGCSAYETLAKKNLYITQVGCLYHARRKCVEADKMSKQKAGIAHQVITLMGKLAKIEERIKPLSPEETYQARQQEAKPILDKMYALLMDKQSKVPPKSTIGLAIHYTLNQWHKLLEYLQDGRLENNNNRLERAIKPFACGRKGWLFCNRPEGAVAAARLYSFIETCKHHGIHAYQWFYYTLQKIPSCTTVEELEALLPYNIDPALLAMPPPP